MIYEEFYIPAPQGQSSLTDLRINNVQILHAEREGIGQSVIPLPFQSFNPSNRQAIHISTEGKLIVDPEIPFNFGEDIYVLVEREGLTVPEDPDEPPTPPPPPEVSASLFIGNNLLAGTVNDVTGISGFTLYSPLFLGQQRTGNHNAFSTAISLEISGTGTGAHGFAGLYRAGELLECIEIDGFATYSFSAFAFTSAQHLSISLTPSQCLEP